MQWGGVDYAAQYGLTWNGNGFLSPNDLVNLQQKYGASKMSFEAATPSAPLPAGFTQGFSQKRGTTNMPDIYTLYYGPGDTASGKMEIHALSAAQNYQSWLVHTSLPLSLYPVNNAEDQFFFADMDNDGKPELFYVVNNPSTGLMELHGLASSNNWQSYYLHVATPRPYTSIQKFSIGDYNNDGIPDLFVVSIAQSGAYLHVLSGASNFSSYLWYGPIPTTSTEVNNCRFISGNFYSHTGNNKVADLVCMKMDQTSSSTPISIVTFNAAEDFSIRRDLGNTQLLGEDGRYAGFGSWDKGSFVGGTPGTNMGIGFLKRQKSPSTEIHWMRAELLF